MFGIIGESYSNVFKLLTREFKLRFVYIQLTVIVSSIVDLLGLASFIPLLGAIADPDQLSDGGILSRMKDYSGLETNEAFLTALFISAFLFFIFRSLVIIGSSWVQNKFVFDLNEFIGHKLFTYYLGESFEDFQRRNSAVVVRDLTINPQHFSKFLVMPLILLTTEFLVLTMIVVGIAVYNFEVFIMLICTIFPVAYLFNRAVKSSMKSYGLQQNALTPILYSNSNRGMFGYIDVVLRNKAGRLIDDYLKVLRRLNRISLESSVIGIVPAKLFELVTVLGLLLLYVYSVFWAKDASLILPLIVIYAAAGYRIIPSLSRVVPSIFNLEKYQYLFDVFERPMRASRKNDLQMAQKIDFNRSIELSGLFFEYKSGVEVLSSINLKLNKGEIIGLVGKSGSGKTTLVQIIVGFLRQQKGRVLIDGVELKDENMIDWMSNISYVQQSPYLETGSLADNVAFLEDEVDKPRLMNALKKASLGDFLDGRDPADVQIEEHGKNLSGGQKQRVVVARALYHKSRLIILDEATSALDNETEMAITETVEGLRGSGVTIIIIAHRLTTLKNVDRIIELKDGRIKN
jgi:ABC-type bacteriocin/lantibiotic exporter with double-glycine peptidase domain